MSVTDSLKKTLKKTSFISRYRPKFGYTVSGERLCANWYCNLFDRIVASRDKNEIDALAEELFSSNRLFADIPEISKKRSELPEDAWERTLKDFENEIEQTPCTALNALQWKGLNTIACMFGLHSTGYVFRKKAIEYLYDKGAGNPDMGETCDFFAAAMELGDFDTARRILEKRLKFKNLFRETERAWIYYNMLCGGSGMKTAKELCTDEHKAYAEYVKGKRIAVVGPASSGDESGGEIDTFDIIIRAAYQGQSHINAKTSGSRTDVAYFNEGKYRELMKMDSKGFIRDLDFLVRKNKKDKLDMPGINERVIFHKGLPFCGKFHMLQLVILDLLLFDAHEIKIFNTNFFLSSNLYDKGYHALIGDITSYDKLTDLSIHDQISQISLFRNLWKNNICKADRALERILSMQNEDIMNDYSKFYPYIWKEKL